MDVNSLYTNIPHADSDRLPNLPQLISTDIPISIDFILKHNTFTFNDKYYLQNNGTAMGTKNMQTFSWNMSKIHFYFPFHLNRLFITDTLMTSS